MAAGVRIVDGSSFALEAAGSYGPLIVAQCWDRSVLSAVKLAPETAPVRPATVLFHLGLPDEKVWEVGTCAYAYMSAFTARLSGNTMTFQVANALPEYFTFTRVGST